MIITNENGIEEVSSGEPVAHLLFDLLRDHVPFGVVEKILKDLEELKAKNDGSLPRAVFSDSSLGRYVCRLTDRLEALHPYKEPLL